MTLIKRMKSQNLREKNKISWVQETQGNENNRNDTPYQDKWFEDFFKNAFQRRTEPLWETHG